MEGSLTLDDRELENNERAYSATRRGTSVSADVPVDVKKTTRGRINLPGTARVCANAIFLSFAITECPFDGTATG
jgi:hypothetical protein